MIIRSTKQFITFGVVLFCLFGLVSPVAAELHSVDLGAPCPTTAAEHDECGMVEGTPQREGTCESSEGITNLVCTAPAAESSGDDNAVEAPSAPISPTFAVNIPTVNITSTQTSRSAEGDYFLIDIPWIADYITGVYRYAVFFGSILAAVIFMVGGLQWLTAGGDAGRIGRAKSRIVDATIGLVLILGSFLVLNTINPELTSLKPLRVKSVPADPMELELQTTTVATGEQGRSGDNSSYPIAGGRGTYTARYFPAGSCPVSLTASGEGPNSDKNIQFFQLIHPRLTGDNGQKFAMAYEAAWLCGVQVGSCGRTISDLAVLAQRGPTADCLQPGYRNSNGDRIGCMDQYSKDRISVRGYSTAVRATPKPSIRDVIATLQGQNEGYPDSISGQLQPGDIVTYYNGNSSPAGGHRVFVASVNERGVAQLLNGSIGRPPYTSDRCFSTRCGNFAPIGYIDRLR